MSIIQIFFLVLGWLTSFYFIGRNELLKNQLTKNLKQLEDNKKTFDSVSEFKGKLCGLFCISRGSSFDQLFEGIKSYDQDRSKRLETLQEKKNLLDKIQESAEKYMVKGTRDVLGAVKGMLVKIKDQKSFILDLEEFKKGNLEGGNKIRIAINLMENATEEQVLGQIKAREKEYKNIVEEKKSLEEKIKKPIGEQDMYYKKELLKGFKIITRQNFRDSFFAILRQYKSKQMIYKYESFFDKMQPIFNGSTEKITIAEFNIKKQNDVK